MELKSVKTIKILDKGFVTLIDAMPNEEGKGDEAIVNAARTSYGQGTANIRNNENLIRYLLRNEHSSPFEMVEFKFLIKVPIFVARQHIRHRTANINEYSGRYSIMENEYYIPSEENLKKQSKIFKQGRDENFNNTEAQEIILNLNNLSENCFNVYNYLISEKTNLSRELARIILPLNTYTKFVWKIDLHNLLRYLKLRMDYHAQYEIRVLAQAIYDIIKPYVPLTIKAFEDYVLDGIKLSKIEKEILLNSINQEKFFKELENKNLSKTEKEEFLRKLNFKS